MGRVLLAEDDALRRRVALKMLKREDESSQRRFLREARAAARVSHPNLCPIFEVGEDGRAAVPGDGAAVGRDALREAAPGAPRAPRGSRPRRGPALCARRPARSGRRAPGRQALQPLPDAARRQAGRLRPRPRAARRRRAQRRDDHRPHQPGADHRDAGLHGAGADPRAGGGRARRPLRRRHRPVRGPHRAAALPRRHRGRRALRRPLRGPSSPRGLPGAPGARRADPPGPGQEAGRALRLGSRDGRGAAGRGEGGGSRVAGRAARAVRRPPGGARLAPGAVRGRRRRRGRGRLRDRRSRRRQERSRRRVPAAGAHAGPSP